MTLEFAPGTVCWVDLMSPDPDQASAFYSSVLGWAFDRQSEEYGGYLMCQAGDGGPAVAGIGRMPEGAQMPSAWTPYLRTDDVRATVAAIEAQGGTVVAPAMEVPHMGHMAIVSDPTGAVVGLWQPIEHTGFAAFGSTGAPCWFEVNTTEAPSVRDYYAELFGLSSEKLEGMEYWTMSDGERPRWGVLQMTDEWEGIPPHWMSYFAVEDTDQAVALVEKHGGEVNVRPFDTPFGRLAVCSDPAGAVFTLMKPAS